jgi:hypothetical protein
MRESIPAFLRLDGSWWTVKENLVEAAGVELLGLLILRKLLNQQRARSAKKPRLSNRGYKNGTKSFADSANRYAVELPNSATNLLD